jgi:hypothetical protein
LWSGVLSSSASFSHSILRASRAFFHLPGRFADHGHVVLERDHVHDAGHGLGGRGVHRLEFLAEGRGPLHHRKQHAFAVEVDAEERLAGDDALVVHVLTDWPMSVKSLGSLSGTSVGTGSLAASAASSP